MELDRSKFMELASAKYEEINRLNDAPNMLDYERGMRDLMNEFTRSVMEAQLKGKSSDYRKKKPSPPHLEK